MYGIPDAPWIRDPERYEAMYYGWSDSYDDDEEDEEEEDEEEEDVDDG